MRHLIFSLLLAHAGLALADDSSRAEVIQKTAALLRENYVDADRAGQLAQALLAHQAELEGLNTPEDFCHAVTETLRGVVPDRHLWMSYEPTREFVPGARDRVVQQDGQQVLRTGRVDGSDRNALAQNNFAFERLEHLDGNIGYLKLSRFVPLEFSRHTARAALDFLEHSDALIIDLRGNIGGAPDLVVYLMSSLLSADAAPVLLHSAENRAQHQVAQLVSDPRLSRPGLAAAPVYVLVDHKTASAAEMLAYIGQRLGRVTVVGETTSGAANGGQKYSVGQGFAMFVPMWKVLTGPGWEGRGIVPDVASADALATARALARKQLKSAT